MAPLPGSNSTAQPASAQAIRSAVAGNSQHLPLLTLWGLQFSGAAVLGQLYLAGVPAWTVPASFWLAFAATVLHVLYHSTVGKRPRHPAAKSVPRKAGRPQTGAQAAPSESRPRIVYGFAVVLLLLLLLPAVLLLAAPPGAALYTELYRALVLAVLYLLLGRCLSRSFLALGVWLVLLTLITAWAYLGFAPLVLGLMSGLSLIACHLLLRRV